MKCGIIRLRTAIHQLSESEVGEHVRKRIQNGIN